MQNICIYCGSSDQMNAEYLQAASDMGAALVERGLRLIYGGGGTGMMGALADAVLENGGEVIGIIPKMFETPELLHTGLTELLVVEDINTRKTRMAEMSDAFVALPGGFGTFDELFEILTWAQIGLHRSPIGILNTLEYFTPLLALIEHARQEGFIYNEHIDLLINESDPQDLLTRMEVFERPPNLERWVQRKEDQ
ncbi:MAG: TIGR00730 family Rossman fold protein [Anaerolineales bacterium]|nr:MAG: TIGR00730 family Rossman fold protein [Anaerolineales bacterium]